MQEHAGRKEPFFDHELKRGWTVAALQRHGSLPCRDEPQTGPAFNPWGEVFAFSIFSQGNRLANLLTQIKKLFPNRSYIPLMFEVRHSHKNEGLGVSPDLSIFALVMASVVFGVALAMFALHLHGFGHTDPMIDVSVLFFLIAPIFVLSWNLRRSILGRS